LALNHQFISPSSKAANARPDSTCCSLNSWLCSSFGPFDESLPHAPGSSCCRHMHRHLYSAFVAFHNSLIRPLLGSTGHLYQYSFLLIQPAVQLSVSAVCEVQGTCLAIQHIYVSSTSASLIAASASNFTGNSTLQATSNVSGTSALSGGVTAV
jgi:hypothetical protein